VLFAFDLEAHTKSLAWVFFAFSMLFKLTLFCYDFILQTFQLGQGFLTGAPTEQFSRSHERMPLLN